MGLRLFFAFWSSLFCILRFGLLLAVFLSDSRSFVSLPVLFGLRPSFSASCASGCSSPLHSSCSLPCCRFSLANPSVVRVLLHCVSAGFLSYSFHRLLLVLVVLFFAPALVLSPSGLPCSVALALWLSLSDSFESPVPVAKWSPFGTSQDDFGLCFLGSSCLPLLVSFLFLSPLHSSALFASRILLVSSSLGGFC